MPGRETIKNLISSNQIADAFAALKSALPKENDLMTLEFQWNTLRREEMMGIIGFSDKTVRSNQIISALLAFTDMVAESGQAGTPNTGNSTHVTGSGNIVIQGTQGSPIHINVPTTTPPSGNPAAPHTPNPANNHSGAKKVFISYSFKDKAYREKLERHLVLLSRGGYLESCSERLLEAGGDWDSDIKTALEESDIYLFLVSSDLLTSEYIWDVEIERALQKVDRKEAIAIPIILHACDWNAKKRGTDEYVFPFARFQALPAGAKPITDHTNEDAAFTEITRALRLLIDKMR